MGRGLQTGWRPFLFLLLLFALKQSGAQDTQQPTRLITQPVKDSDRVTLAGNTRPEANPANDRGPVPNSLAMDHLQLTLRLPGEKQNELDRFLSEVQDPQSPRYHKWLTPRQFNQEFGLAPQDIDTITKWLRSEGFRVNTIRATSVDFSGTAAQVESAFRIDIHYLDVDGTKHIANMSDPQIPAALAPAVSGIVSLNDFRPRPQTVTGPTQKSSG